MKAYSANDLIIFVPLTDVRHFSIILVFLSGQNSWAQPPKSFVLCSLESVNLSPVMLISLYIAWMIKS